MSCWRPGSCVSREIKGGHGGLVSSRAGGGGARGERAAALTLCRAVDWNADRDNGTRDWGRRIYVTMETSTR